MQSIDTTLRDAEQELTRYMQVAGNPRQYNRLNHLCNQISSIRKELYYEGEARTKQHNQIA